MTALIQTDQSGVDVSTSFTLTLTNVQLGSLIVVQFVQTSSNTRTYTFTDDKGNTYTQIEQADTGNSRRVIVAYAVAATSGTTIITIDSNFPQSGLNAVAYEIESTGLDVSDTSQQSANATSHPCGSIDTVANTIIFASMVWNSNPSTITLPLDYTEVRNGNYYTMMYFESASALTDEDALILTSTARTSVGAIVSFVTGQITLEPNLIITDSF